jgi:predicted nucleotidyltransferase
MPRFAASKRYDVTMVQLKATAIPEPQLEIITNLARDTAELDLLILYGSRSRGDVHPHSDWDLGFLSTAAFDRDEFLARLVLALETEAIDLVDLSRAGALLRFRAAAEGRTLFARDPEQFDRFWLEAVHFWCDMQPVIQREYDAILAGVRG